MSEDRVALVLFVCDPRIEAARKPILGGYSVGVHAALLADAAERLRAARADLVLAWRGEEARAWALKPRAVVVQRGRSFGERLSGAVRDAVALGYAKVVVVGSDCPSLDATMVDTAVAKLAEVDVVVVPARDGGVNLLAVRAAHLAKLEFASLPWETHTLGEALTRALTAAGLTTLTLTACDDLDNAEALGRHLEANPDSRLARLVRRALPPNATFPPLRGRGTRTSLLLFGPSLLSPKRDGG